ncbi:hypothetical protein EDD21DRAFT_370759 [Dissophora ornata]|nr:hypothetical protein EDD21DRAFT_370759 [Dissophora ornata]
MSTLSSQSPANKVFSIPEIAECIIQYLGPRHICCVRLVSRTFHAVCHWRISLALEIGGSRSVPTKQFLKESGHLVKSLTIRLALNDSHWTTVGPSVLAYCPFIERLVINARHEVVYSVLDCISFLPELKFVSLNIALSFNDGPLFDIYVRRFRQQPGGPSLESLELSVIGGKSLLSWDTVLAVLRTHRDLESLTLDQLIITIQPPYSSQTPLSRMDYDGFSSLTSLTITDSRSLPETAMLALGYGCPNLRLLNVSSIHQIWSPRLQIHPAAMFPSLQEISILLYDLECCEVTLEWLRRRVLSEPPVILSDNEGRVLPMAELKEICTTLIVRAAGLCALSLGYGIEQIQDRHQSQAEMLLPLVSLPRQRIELHALDIYEENPEIMTIRSHRDLRVLNWWNWGKMMYLAFGESSEEDTAISTATDTAAGAAAIEKALCSPEALSPLQMSQKLDGLVDKFLTSHMEFASTLTALSLGAETHVVLDDPLRMALLGAMLRKMPMLTDLAIGDALRDLSLFDGLGRQLTIHNMQADTKEDWGKERPYLEKLSVIIAREKANEIPAMKRLLIKKFRFLVSEHVICEGYTTRLP